MPTERGRPRPQALPAPPVAADCGFTVRCLGEVWGTFATGTVDSMRRASALRSTAWFRLSPHARQSPWPTPPPATRQTPRGRTAGGPWRATRGLASNGPVECLVTLGLRVQASSITPILACASRAVLACYLPNSSSSAVFRAAKPESAAPAAAAFLTAASSASLCVVSG